MEYISINDAINYVQEELEFTNIRYETIVAIIIRCFEIIDNSLRLHISVVKSVISSKIHISAFALHMDIDVNDCKKILNVYLGYLILNDRWRLCHYE